MSDTYNDQIQGALIHAEQKAQQPTDRLTLSTGVVLRYKPFPLLRLQAVGERFPDPDIPKRFNPEKQRYEENPADPHYVAAVEKVNAQRGMAVMDTIMAVGTEVVHIPDGFPTPDDEDWTDELEISGIVVKRESRISRYFSWVKFVALANESDLAAVVEFVSRFMGTSEENVASQLQTNFPDNETRPTN